MPACCTNSSKMPVFVNCTQTIDEEHLKTLFPIIPPKDDRMNWTLDRCCWEGLWKATQQSSGYFWDTFWESHANLYFAGRSGKIDDIVTVLLFLFRSHIVPRAGVMQDVFPEVAKWNTSAELYFTGFHARPGSPESSWKAVLHRLPGKLSPATTHLFIWKVLGVCRIRIMSRKSQHSDKLPSLP